MKLVRFLKSKLPAISLTAFIFCLLSYSVIVLADDGVIVPPSGDEWAALLASLGGLKGAGVLGIVAIVVQGLMLAARQFLVNVAGKWKFALVSGLSLVGGILALKLTGIDWVAALMHSSTLAAAQVFLHQMILQFQKDE